MTRKTLYAALIAIASAVAIPSIASAESFFFGYGGPHGGFAIHGGDPFYQVHRPHRPRFHHGRHLTPREVRRSLRYRGFYNIRFIDRYPPRYTVRATNHRGRRVVLVVRSRNAQIVSVRRLHRYRRHHS